jgi:hypothetical protein
MININNDRNFGIFLASLIREEIQWEDNTNVEDDNYHWFLSSLLDCIEKDAALEIMDDSNGSFVKYRIASALAEERMHYLRLSLKKIPTNEEISLEYTITNVLVNIGEKFSKYYIDTPQGRFRFTII